MEEKDCPKCKEGVMNRLGIFRNEVTLNIDENNIPQYFNDEVEEFRALYSPDETFWQCENCEYKEKIEESDKNVELQN